MKRFLVALCACLGLVTYSAFGEIPWSGPEVHAASLGADFGVRMSHGTKHRWQPALKEANRRINANPVARVHDRVRIVFRDGGWIEFTPSPAAIASDRLPPLLKMQFPNA